MFFSKKKCFLEKTYIFINKWETSHYLSNKTKQNNKDKMADKKSIIEEALLDINNIQNALNANTKEILRSVAKEEINGVVKESLMDEVYEEEDLEDAEDLALEPMADETGDEESEDDMLDDIESSDEVEPEMGSEVGMDTDVLGGDEIDMTGASDEDVIAIYKKLSGEDEIEIVGDEIHMNITEPGEYVVKLDGNAPSEESEEELDLEPAGDESFDDEDADDVEYEIEMDDESEEGDEDESEESEEGEEGESEEGEEDEEETEEITEAIPVGSGQAHRTPYKADLGQPKGAGADNLKESENARKLVSETAKKYNSLLTEATKLKAENDEFRAALKEFRTKLVETVVFNSNLTYVTKLFMEHSTTKGEKQNIIKRFDEEVTNLKESKKLYKTIANELEARQPITEAVENKIIKEATTSTSKQLNESTAYVDPSTKRIMDLINRVEKR